MRVCSRTMMSNWNQKTTIVKPPPSAFICVPPLLLTMQHATLIWENLIETMTDAILKKEKSNYG